MTTWGSAETEAVVAVGTGALTEVIPACAAGRLLEMPEATTGVMGGGNNALLMVTTAVGDAVWILSGGDSAGVGEALDGAGAPAVGFISLAGFPKVPEGTKNPGGGPVAAAPDPFADGDRAPSQPCICEKIRHR